ncbi:MAG: cysteine--tRNA ligase [Treponema sp.]|nr:cysteine--tRNA ligase [Treponema sp.]
MALKLYNTMGRKIEEFKPRVEGKVGFYGCGPTVYNYAHIGNLRAYVFLDTLHRTLEFLGYEVNHVMNITDIGHLSGDADDGEDKMVKMAAERKQSVLDIAKFYTDAFHNDIDRLNIIRPTTECPATQHVQEMIELIKKIEANGHTYMAGGNLYYDTSTYADYGKLANLKLDELKEGAGKRKEVVIDENKKNPHDFVLWFTKSKFENQALTWDSPWGVGYPGWHIECSAMSMKYLGKHFDIHTGGIDHVPVHHTNEIAQSEGSFTEEDKKDGAWVNYWMHNAFLVIEGATKMSKSSGNFLTLQSLIDKGYDPMDYRFFLLGAHYRSPANFSWNSMDSAKNSRRALIQRASKVLASLKDSDSLNPSDSSANQSSSPVIPSSSSVIPSAVEGSLSDAARAYLDAFTTAMENDLATPQALAQLQKSLKDENLSAGEKLALIRKMDSVLGLKVEESALNLLKEAAAPQEDTHAGDPEAEEINALVKARQDAKAAKDWAKADEIRNELTKRGITIVDTPTGPTWKRG